MSEETTNVCICRGAVTDRVGEIHVPVTVGDVAGFKLHSRFHLDCPVHGIRVLEGTDRKPKEAPIVDSPDARRAANRAARREREAKRRKDEERQAHP